MPQFMVVGGSHRQKDEKGKEVDYDKGSVIESQSDLAARFGRGKFVPYESEVPRSRIIKPKVFEGEETDNTELPSKKTPKLKKRKTADD